MNIFFLKSVFAHEAYVLPQKVFEAGLATTATDPLGPLFGSEYWRVTAIVLAIFGVVYFLNFVLAASGVGRLADKWLRKFSRIGPVVVRLALAASFLYGAQSGNVFGPELRLSEIAFGQVILPLKVVLGLMFLLGIGTEVAAMAGIVIFLIVWARIGGYVLTYLNYLGELVALVLFGSRPWSVDEWLFGKKLWSPGLLKFQEWEVPIVRIGLGVALLYTAWNIKFQHQILPIEVVSQYHLERYFFFWTAAYIAAGAGMVELMIGLFVLVGFAQRLTVLIFMVFITLSLLYFREAVWPHLMLYGISVMIFIDSADRLTIDRYLIPWIRRIWRRRVGQ